MTLNTGDAILANDKVHAKYVPDCVYNTGLIRWTDILLKLTFMCNFNNCSIIIHLYIHFRMLIQFMYLHSFTLLMY